jgi:DNA-binding NarL/FixJ family response regulator
MTKPNPENKTDATRIVLVDDHPIVREGLAETINREPGLAVCAQAEDRAQALQAIETMHPGLAIVDLTLKTSSGLELIKDIHARWPEMLILVVSMHDETLYAERVLRAGAHGYITKQEASRDILQAIRRVLEGGVYLNERTSSAILARLSSKGDSLVDSITDLLTDRELEVFQLTGRGFNTREIALQLHIDIKTIDTYRSRIKQKLNLPDTSAILKLAIRWNQEQNRL